jgi:hypothetical protein
MDKKEKITLALQVVTVICTLLIAIAGYVFVYRFQVRESKANTELVEIESSLKRIEAEIGQIKQKLEVAQKQVELSGDIMEVIAKLRPHLTLKYPSGDYNPKTLTSNFELTNTGSYMIFIEAPEVRLLREEIEDYNDYSKDFILGKDYSVEPCRPTTCQPMETLKKIVVVQLHSPIKKYPVYLWVTFEARTDPTVCNFAKNYLGDLVSEDIIDSTSWASSRQYIMVTKKGLFGF